MWMLLCCGCAILEIYLRRPPPRPPPPPRDMLENPRLLLLRALGPLYPLEPPPNASRLPPPERDRSREPMRSGPPPSDPPLGRDAGRLPSPPPPARLPAPPEARLPGRVPPVREICWRALACRLASESPRVVPPNRSAVARSR